MVNICGIEVDFPFKPYECQKTYMEKVIACIQHGENGVLESPTGTGKTLCLLCATLAWRETFMAKVQYDYIKSSKKIDTTFSESLNKKLGDPMGSNDNPDKETFSAPKIVYASRTHSQISQVISELKNTRYNPSVCVLGSREQMCINSEVQKEENNNGKVHMCRVKVANKQCFYYNNLEVSKSNLSPGIRDIEDLVAEGKEKKFCPYYMSREMGKQADITFMPYNYILDFKARSNQSIDLANSIVILDEGHNVESVCEDNMSFDFTSFDLASCVDDSQQCIEILLQKEEEGFTDGDEFKCELTTEDATLMKSLFLQLEGIIGDIELDKNESATKHPSFLLEKFARLNINDTSRDQIIETIEQMSSMLAASNSKFIKSKTFALDKFGKIIKTIFSKEEGNHLSSRNTQKFYKVHIQAEKNNKERQKKLDVWATRTSSSNEKPRTLSYWCFNPGLTMRELMIQGIRSLILTSGTLSPLSSFKQELAIPFTIELENSHVIDKHQVLVAVIPQGPDGKRLNSSYQYRSTPEYQISLGNTVINMSRIIPNGVLIFFPSYGVMDMVIAKWQSCGIWDRLGIDKGLFIEPRRKNALNETMEQYYEKVNDPKLKGAIFFAVCRGKVSEGLDFADANGRAVIITGLPFPPSMDPKVILKRQFLDEQKTPDSLSGQVWYRQQASRAVNQAIGRVIRHRNDYGAILLCDERFCNRDAQAHLPVWIKDQIRVYRNFGSVQRDLVLFFKNIRQKMGLSDEKAESKRKVDKIYENNEAVGSKSKQKSMKFNEHNSPKSSSDSYTNTSFNVLSSPYITNSNATSALSRLESCSMKKTSLFDSLHQKDSACKEDQQLKDTLSSQLFAGKENGDTQVKSKKYKIVKSNPDKQTFFFDDSSKTSDSGVGIVSATPKEAKFQNKNIVENKLVPTNSSLSCSVKNEKIQQATQYLKKLKKVLSPERYGSFSKSLSLYKKSKNINVLFLQFKDIYDFTKSSHLILLKEFIIFVRDDDKESFKKMCESVNS